MIVDRRINTQIAFALACMAVASTVAFASPDTTSPGPPATKSTDKVFLGAIINSAHSDTAESTAGDLIADAVRATGHADIGMAPADEIAADKQIPAGSHSVNDLLGLLCYAQDETDTIVTLDLTGKQIEAAMERSVSRVPQPFDGFLQISGFQVRFDATKPEGSRVMEAGVPGAPISETKHYTVAMPRAIANGSFGYFRVWDKSAIVGDTGVTVAKSLTDYAATHPTLSPMIEGRIVGL
jgi:2',3'-cyclic-nucleotide 2'-phosphodiesterase (5'-nucleotidase family)